MIKYSVIIPQRDCADLTRRCVQSIPDRDDIQVIVVDDNSKDVLSLHQLESDIGRRNVSFVYTTDGKGAGYARNVGLNMAVGEWLIFSDADDFFTSDAFMIFDQYSDADIDIIYFYHKSVYSDTLEPCKRYDSRNEYLTYYKNRPNKKSEDELKYADVVPWAKMFRKSVVDEHNQKFDEVPASNDVTFVSRMAYYANNIAVCEDVVYVLTYRRGSITRTINKTNELSRYMVCLRFNTFLKEIGCKRLRNRIVSRVAIAYRNFGIKEALYYLKLAHQYNQSIFTALLPNLRDLKFKFKTLFEKNSYRG